MGIIDADIHIDETDATRKPERVLRTVTSVRGDTLREANALLTAQKD